MKKRISLGVVEDHDLVREGMISLLKEEEGLHVLFDVGNSDSLFEKLKRQKPDILLLDIAMSSGLNGNESIDIIRDKYPGVKVIVISMHYTRSYINEMIGKGARAFLPKNCKIEEVVDTIYRVYEGGRYYNPAVSKVIGEKLMEGKNIQTDPDETVLIGREIEIVKLICNQKSNEEISKAVFLSKRTVEWHKQNIMRKTNSKTVAGLVLYAIRKKIIPNPENLDSSSQQHLED